MNVSEATNRKTESEGSWLMGRWQWNEKLASGYKVGWLMWQLKNTVTFKWIQKNSEYFHHKRKKIKN